VSENGKGIAVVNIQYLNRDGAGNPVAPTPCRRFAQWDRDGDEYTKNGEGRA